MFSKGNKIKTTMQPTNALMEFREIEKKTVPGIKAFQMNSMLNRKRNRNDKKKIQQP